MTNAIAEVAKDKQLTKNSVDLDALRNREPTFVRPPFDDNAIAIHPPSLNLYDANVYLFFLWYMLSHA
jgi:hypothetical protein